MDDEKDLYFKQLIAVCSITVVIELILFFWSYFQVENLNSSNVVAIQLAAKGVMSFITLLFASWITTCVSIFIPQIKVWNLYQNIDDHKNHKFATIAFTAYWIVPLANTVYSISGAALLIKEAGLSVFKMIEYLL